MSKSPFTLPTIIAHRGASAHAPENTLPALKLAYDMGAKWLECDVMLTDDGVAVVHHDRQLRRTTNGRGSVAKSTYQAIQQLDAGSWFHPDYQNAKVPTLGDWVSHAAQLGMGINLEMKVRGPDKASELARLILQSLQCHWRADLPPPLISSFSPHCLKAMRRLDATIALALVAKQWSKRVLSIAKRYGCVAVHLSHHIVTAERVATLKSMQRHVMAYTVNQKELLDQLLAMGVDGIFTDDLKNCNPQV